MLLHSVKQFSLQLRKTFHITTVLEYKIASHSSVIKEAVLNRTGGCLTIQVDLPRVAHTI